MGKAIKVLLKQSEDTLKRAKNTLQGLQPSNCPSYRTALWKRRRVSSDCESGDRLSFFRATSIANGLKEIGKCIGAVVPLLSQALAHLRENEQL